MKNSRKSSLKGSRTGLLKQLGLGVAWTLFTFIVAAISAIAVPLAYNDAIYSVVGPKVVELLAIDGRGGGTGFLIETKKGTKLLTNAHVCELADKDGHLKAYFENGYEYDVTIKAVDKDGADLCLLDAPEGYQGLTLNSAPPKMQEWVEALGHPMLEPLQVMDGYIIARESITSNEKIVDQEHCTGLGKRFYYDLDQKQGYCLWTEMSYSSTIVVAPGASGSPVVNIYGKVVAVVFAYNTETHHAHLILWSAIRDFLESIPE